MRPHGPKTRAELRRFGWVMAGALGAIAGYLAWRGRPWWVVPAALAAAFALAATAAPGVLRPVERGWMWFGERMGIVMTFVLLTLTFVLIVTPLGFVMRLTGRDRLRVRPRSRADSYWVPADPGPGERPYRPY